MQNYLCELRRLTHTMCHVAWENEKQDVRKYFGDKLKKYRQDAKVSVVEVAKAAGVGRQYVYLVEKGKANFTIDSYVDMLRACGVPFNEAIAGLQTSDIPVEHQPFHEKLSTILKSGIGELIQGIRVNVEAISEKALRLRKARASPPRPTQVAEPRETGERRKKRSAGS